jgi:hypothetical protein
LPATPALRVALALAALQLALLHDLFVLGATLLLSSAVARLLPGRGRPKPSSCPSLAVVVS